MKGYVFCHRLSNGEYEAVGYDWCGYVITAPTWAGTYSAAYGRIYRLLKV